LLVKFGVVKVKGWILPVMCRNTPPPSPSVVCPTHDVKFMFVVVSVPPVILTNTPPPLPFAPEHEQDWHVAFVTVVESDPIASAATDPFPVFRTIVKNDECSITLSLDVPTV